jgi:hypothetical protein
MLSAFALQPDSAMLRRLFEKALERAPGNGMKWRTRPLAQAARDLGLFPSRRCASLDVLSVFEQTRVAPIIPRTPLAAATLASGLLAKGDKLRRAVLPQGRGY